jgi:hypothetical protein
VQSLCTLRGRCRQGPRNIRYQAGATPYSDRSSTAGSHQLAWRTHSITSSARASSAYEVGMPGHFVLSWSPARTRGRSARAASAIGGSAASLNRPIAFDGGYHSSGLGARNVRLGSNCDLPVRLGHVEPVSGQGRMSKTAHTTATAAQYHAQDRRKRRARGSAAGKSTNRTIASALIDRVQAVGWP